MSSSLSSRCAELVERLGLAAQDDIVAVAPLTGGVASDIAVVTLRDRQVAAKFALEKLRVSEEWHAPVSRNEAEYRWLEFAGTVVPGSAPLLYGRDAESNGFVMEFCSGDDVYLWKTSLLHGRIRPSDARRVGNALGRIHAASSNAEFDRQQFQNQLDFYDLRLAPYLRFTAERHPALAPVLESLIEGQQKTSLTLIHGDVSPKNILFRNRQPVFLDAECATMGDPAFDVAFCINHLVLKALHMPARAGDLMCSALGLWYGYADFIVWERVSALEARVSALLPALMLARVDGKSPVDYLDDANRNAVRTLANLYLGSSPERLPDLLKLLTGATARVSA